MTDRRTALLAAAVPAFAGAQQPGRSYRIGRISLTARTESYAMAMVRRLAKLGFVEGRNLTIAFRRVDGGAQAFGDASADMAQLGCELIFAPGNTVGLRAVLDSTRDLPLVTVPNATSTRWPLAWHRAWRARAAASPVSRSVAVATVPFGTSRQPTYGAVKPTAAFRVEDCGAR